MKWLWLVLLVGLGVYLLRHRVKLALQVAGGLYLAITVVRLIQLENRGERLLEVVGSLLIFGAVWALLWLLVRMKDLRRARSRPQRESLER